MRKTRCCYLLVERSKKTMETTYKRLRAERLAREGRSKMNGRGGRREYILRVQFWAVETHKESVGELVS